MKRSRRVRRGPALTHAEKILVMRCGYAYHNPCSGSSVSILGDIAMTDQPSTAVQAQVRAQFDRQVAHYMQGNAMADQGLLELIVRMAGPTAELRA
jgi:hypothetical protein